MCVYLLAFGVGFLIGRKGCNCVNTNCCAPSQPKKVAKKK